MRARGTGQWRERSSGWTRTSGPATIEIIDAREEVGEQDSFGLSMELSRAGLICGPSSGFNLKGLHKFLARRKEAGTLKDLAGPDGEIILMHAIARYHA